MRVPLRASRLCLLSAALLLWPRVANAQDPVDPADAGLATLGELELLREEVAVMRKQLEAVQSKVDTVQSDVQAVQADVGVLRPVGKIGGSLDVGFFSVQGDGSGTRTDLDSVALPEYRGVVPDSWVFLGDPLATAVNSRGEPADTGESRAITFDSVNAGNRPTFIVNAINLSLFAGLGEVLTFNGSLDFVPRNRNVSDPRGLFLGDFLDVKLAYAEYLVPIELFALALSVGKFDPVLGIEYRSQDAPDRLGITPSLICRYTCGRPIGLKGRAKLFDDALVVALAVTNGSSFVELFPFANELDTNLVKTVSGRLSYRLPLGSGLELGASGAAGSQDNQLDDGVLQWHYGFDAKLELRDFIGAAEFVTGRALGKTESGQSKCGVAPCLFYRGAYGLFGYRVTNWVTPYVRVDWRDAVHRSGASFVYLSQLVRFTGGLHFELGEHVLIKAEYVLVKELERIPEFPNDVFTTSLVLKY